MRNLTIALGLLVIAGCSKPQPQPGNQAQPEAQAGPVKGVDRSHKGEQAADVTFADPDGGDISLGDFKGTPVLLNLWASWCAPCVKELPTLDKLAAAHRVDGQLAVVAVSQDNGPRTSVEAFLEKLKVQDLGAYQDSKMALSGTLGPDAVLPTSILFDANGKEVWRYVGDLDWTGPDAAKLIAEAKPGGKR
jgi:thiol-disulfide isomerase/thioredoxin